MVVLCLHVVQSFSQGEASTDCLWTLMTHHFMCMHGSLVILSFLEWMLSVIHLCRGVPDVVLFLLILVMLQQQLHERNRVILHFARGAYC